MLRNLLICSGMANRERGLQITMPPWHCHQRGGLPVSEHRQRKLKAGTHFGPINIPAQVLNERAPRRLR
jgi:hypothetical protein